MQAGRSIESIFAELAGAGLVRQPVAATLEEFLGGERLAQEPEPTGLLSATATAAAAPTVKAKTGGKKANVARTAPPTSRVPGGTKAGGKAGLDKEKEAPEAYEAPSLAQARQEVAASCVLPLGAHAAMAKLAFLG